MEWRPETPSNNSKSQKLFSRRAAGDDADAGDPGNVIIPSSGISVNDDMERAQKDKFSTALYPYKKFPGVAQLLTTATGGGLEPLRYVVALSPPPKEADMLAKDDGESTSITPAKFAMVDVPPYSDELVTKIRNFMGNGASLCAILVTNKDSIHYDESPAVYVTRKSDLDSWITAFPGVEIVAYRLDIPRDCQEVVTQRIDGYGPWALEEGHDGMNNTFTETGRPLTYLEWDEETTAKVLDQGETPPDDNVGDLDDADLYTPETIRAREEKKRILAVYTPGHTFGSVTFVFPETQVCCPGYTIPIEDNRDKENLGMKGAGPSLDYRGYITTNSAGLGRQMEGARHIAKLYSDRFRVILPARGDALFLDDDNAAERASTLLDIIDQYDKIGRIYERLGITSSGPIDD